MSDFSRFAAKSPLLIKLDDQLWFIPTLSAGIELGIRHYQITVDSGPELWARVVALAVRDPVLDYNELLKSSPTEFLRSVYDDILREFPLWEPPESEESEESSEKKTAEETIDALELMLCWLAFWYRQTIKSLLEDTMDSLQAMAKNLPRLKDEYFLSSQEAHHGVYTGSEKGTLSKAQDFDSRMARVKAEGDRLLRKLDQGGYDAS